MDTTIETTYNSQTGTLYFFHDLDEYSCYFAVENDDSDVTFHASNDSFDSFDEFRADIEANFDSDVTSLLF